MIDPIEIALMRKLVGSGGGGSGVQADYAQNDFNAADYIKNRPGGYYDDYEITWDGEIGDRLVVDVGEGKQMVKVSDRVFTTEELVGGEVTITASSDEDTWIITPEEIHTIPPGLALGESIFIISAPVEPCTETGTYFRCEPSTQEYVKSLRNKFLVKIPADLTTMEGGYYKKIVLFDETIPSDMLEIVP